MHQPPIRPHIERMGFTYREIEHLLGLLDGGDIGNDASGAVCLLILSPILRWPAPTQLLFKSSWLTGLGLAVSSERSLT